MRLTVVSSGVDAFYLSFRGVVDPNLLEALDELKAQAQETGEPIPIFLPDGRATRVQASGWGHYRYWLHTRDFDVFVAKGEKLPAAYVRIRSEYLHAVGPEAAAARLKRPFARALSAAAKSRRRPG